MNEFFGSVLVLAVVCLLVLIAGYRFATMRRQLGSGNSIGIFHPLKLGNEFIFKTVLNVTRRERWCRLLLTFETIETNSIQYAPKFLLKEVAFLSGTSYTLTLKDARDHVIHTETGSLGPFVAWLKSRYRGSSTIFSERSSGGHQGTVTLLEFLPEEAGLYTVVLNITAKTVKEHPGSSSTWEISKVELEARENVIPFSKAVSYPHNRVRI